MADSKTVKKYKNIGEYETSATVNYTDSTGKNNYVSGTGTAPKGSMLKTIEGYNSGGYDITGAGSNLITNKSNLAFYNGAPDSIKFGVDQYASGQIKGVDLLKVFQEEHGTEGGLTQYNSFLANQSKGEEAVPFMQTELGKGLGITSMAMSGLQTIGNLYYADKNYDLAKDQYKTNKHIAMTNLKNGIKSYNNNLDSRATFLAGLNNWTEEKKEAYKSERNL